MLSKRRGVFVALIIGSVIGGTAGATILDAASASRGGHERAETAQVQAYEHAHASRGGHDRTETAQVQAYEHGQATSDS